MPPDWPRSQAEPEPLLCSFLRKKVEADSCLDLPPRGRQRQTKSNIRWRKRGYRLLPSLEVHITSTQDRRQPAWFIGAHPPCKCPDPVHTATPCLPTSPLLPTPTWGPRWSQTKQRGPAQRGCGVGSWALTDQISLCPLPEPSVPNGPTSEACRAAGTGWGKVCDQDHRLYGTV